MTTPAMRAYFKESDVLEAEELLVGLCVHDEYAWAVTFQAIVDYKLPLEPFHDERLNVIFGILSVWHDRGLYNEQLNEEHLAAAFTRHSRRIGDWQDETSWQHYFDALWSPYAHLVTIPEAVLEALVKHHELVETRRRAELAFLEEEPFRRNPLIVDTLFAELGPAIARLKAAGIVSARKPESTPPPAPHRGTLDVFSR